METLCRYCGTPYIPKRTDALYCSQACKQASYVLRKAGTLTSVRKHRKTGSINEQSQNDGYLYREEGRHNYPSSEPKELFIGQDQVTDNPHSYPSLSINKHSFNAENVTDKREKDLPNMDMGEYEPYESQFLQELKELIEERDYVSVMDYLNYSSPVQVCWVSERYKCLLECLLLFSERKTIEGNDLKEVCNAFTCLIYSEFFDSLPSSYPYTSEILKLREKLRNICLNLEINCKPFPFVLQRSTKQKFIASRWELSNYFPKVSFNELDFN